MLAEAIIGHLVGDYLLQNDWMAQNKKRSSAICAVHCFIWTASVCLLTGWGIVAAAILFLTHFVQDRFRLVEGYMAWMGQESFAKPPLAPWSVIVVDNTFHLLTIYVVSRELTS